MRNAVLNGVRAVLLGGPTVLAFFTGGYFDPPRRGPDCSPGCWCSSPR